MQCVLLCNAELLKLFNPTAPLCLYNILMAPKLLFYLFIYFTLQYATNPLTHEYNINNLLRENETQY